MEYTKGPWKVCGANKGECKCHLVWSVTNDCVVAMAVSAKDEAITCGEGLVNEAMICANANLISAAPELYEALKAIKEWSIKYCEIPDSLIIPASKALAKAEGKVN